MNQGEKGASQAGKQQSELDHETAAFSYSTPFNVLASLEGSRLSCWGIGGARAALDAGIVVARNGSEGLGAPMRRSAPFRGQRVN
jgi:hypothetical protein